MLFFNYPFLTTTSDYVSGFYRVSVKHHGISADLKLYCAIPVFPLPSLYFVTFGSVAKQKESFSLYNLPV